LRRCWEISWHPDRGRWVWIWILDMLLCCHDPVSNCNSTCALV